ncbi:hypothetical protein LEP1GSC061_3860 [Leptospira wolffii serovar Khorat str. Khorat-H2]|nr:hypothetical protein LEP1GSC061_3860 [Leptospira wolffii serovar Khorat str. Khorat-H2]
MNLDSVFVFWTLSFSCPEYLLKMISRQFFWMNQPPDAPEY